MISLTIHLTESCVDVSFRNVLRRSRQDLEMSGVLGLETTLSAPDSHHKCTFVFLNILFYIGVQLVSNVMLVSGVH